MILFKYVTPDQFEVSSEKNLYFKFFSKLLNDTVYIFKNGSDIQEFPIQDAVIFLEDEAYHLLETLKNLPKNERREKIKNIHTIKKEFKGRILPEESRYYKDPDPSFAFRGDSHYWARLSLWSAHRKAFHQTVEILRKAGFYFGINTDGSLQLKYPPDIESEGKQLFLLKYLMPYQNELKSGIAAIQGIN